MKRWIDRILLTALVIVVAVLAATAVPVLRGGHLGGRLLLGHMAASGALVLLLPMFAISGLWKHMDVEASSAAQRWGFWTVVVTGLLTIATVFVCMLPLPSTSEMETLISWHRYAGWAMVLAMVTLCWGYRK